MQLTFTSSVEQHVHGRATIHLITLPNDEADFLNSLDLVRCGFGSIKVSARLGRTIWRTSVFPNEDTFILLLARKLLAAEQIDVGDEVTVQLNVIV